MVDSNAGLNAKFSSLSPIRTENLKLGKTIFTPPFSPHNNSPIHSLHFFRGSQSRKNLPEIEAESSLRPSIGAPNDICTVETSLDKLTQPTDPNPLDWDEPLTDTNKRTRHGVKLSMREVRSMIEIWGLPPFLTLEEAAKIANRSTSVLRNHVSEGRFPRSAIVGKPLTFITTRYLQEVAARLRRNV